MLATVVHRNRPVLTPRNTAVPPDILPSLFGEGTGAYEVRPANFVLSFLAHTLAAAVIIYSGQFLATHPQEIRRQIVTTLANVSEYIPLPPSATRSGGGGGGGDRDKLAASKGLPPKFSMQQITPPTAIIRNYDPKLAVEQTVMVPPQIKLPTSQEQVGDPLSAVLAPSNGPGYGSGIGSACCGGIGSGYGRGVGPGTGAGIGGGPFRVGGGVSAPRAIYTPDPEYSEEARKAKYQGTVVLWVVIGPDGRVHDLRVQRTLGLGLDEKALEAVRQWRFEPARKDGQPVAVQINVEVNFHLY